MNTRVRKVNVVQEVPDFVVPQGLDTPPHFPSATRSEDGSLSVQETRGMLLSNLAEIRKGEAKFGKVQVPEHSPEPPSNDVGEHYENNAKQHPEFIDSQRMDGNEAIPDITDWEARRKFDNEKREQDKEKQNRLENVHQNVPQFNPRPR